ncbi:hypothetical protein DAPPUDRAFT_316935 [Daphnia pulex]|uniref:Uncharacterized protein n=1 Tax=Daphnia pulex TaxID=6669 RepID=E9GEE7_DAPPU|nr:hypothetical protein DAPPUDRAFT_316935 [Daphnia pulex]|eukprot:EFX82253.1 hypothetical protein DAPPUDRAFT_316935 [Daphnia pulex]
MSPTTMLTVVFNWIISWFLGEDYQNLVKPKPTGPTNPGQKPNLPPPPIPVTPATGLFEGDCGDPYYSYPKHVPIQLNNQPPSQRYARNEQFHRQLLAPPQRPDMFYVEMQNRFRQMEEQQKIDQREIYELRINAVKMQAELDEIRSNLNLIFLPQPAPMGWTAPHPKKDGGAFDSSPTTTTSVKPESYYSNAALASSKTQNDLSSRMVDLIDVNNWGPIMPRPNSNERNNVHPPFVFQMAPPKAPPTIQKSTGQIRNQYRRHI